MGTGAEETAGVLRSINRRLVVLTTFLGFVLVLCPLLFWAFEHTRNPNVRHVTSGYQWLFRTLFETASAYKIITGPGFVVYYVVRVAGVSLVAFASGTIASRLVSNVILKGRGMGATRASGHIVICGWSSKGNEILRELRAREVDESRDVVVLAPLDSDPAKGGGIEFIKGDPSDADDLTRAGIERCDTAIILADETHAGHSALDRDARTLLTCLAVESLNPGCYTCVEVIKSENRVHFARTRVNEVVVSAELTGALLAGSARNHGLSRLVADLVTHPDGMEFYRFAVPGELVGLCVREALGTIKERYDAVLVGFVNDDDDRFDLNPGANRVLAAGDVALVICDHLSDAVASTGGRP